MMDLIVMNRSELFGNVGVGGRLDCCDQTQVQFTVLRNMGQVGSKVRSQQNSSFSRSQSIVFPGKLFLRVKRSTEQGDY